MSEIAALEVRGLTRRFGARVAVDDLTLTVLQGDVYGFLGPNGAGKTTAIRCMLGLIRRDAGRVTIFGEADEVVARSLVGAIVETPAFHGWMTGRQNLAQAAAYAGVTRGRVDVEIDRVLERVGLGERAGDRAATYSLGMKQRLGIARALLGRPRLLILDEPTNGLDPRGMREMRELIRSLALHDRITVLVSSHLLAEVQAICNRVGILQAGRLRAEGRVDKLLGQGDAADVIEVGASDAAALEAAVHRLDGCEALGPGRNGRLMVRHDIPAAALLRSLMADGVEVTAFVPSERSLEDVFLEVTR
jgi:ABC-type multidrug transport system ATPase subunit